MDHQQAPPQFLVLDSLITTVQKLAPWIYFGLNKGIARFNLSIWVRKTIENTARQDSLGFVQTVHLNFPVLGTHMEIDGDKITTRSSIFDLLKGQTHKAVQVASIVSRLLNIPFCCTF